MLFRVPPMPSIKNARNRDSRQEGTSGLYDWALTVSEAENEYWRKDYHLSGLSPALELPSGRDIANSG